MSDRSAILISCLKQEAAEMRERARLDQRSDSSYLLKILMRWVEFEERLYADFARFLPCCFLWVSKHFLFS